MKITAKQWQHFDREGFLRLGQVASEQQLVDMQQRINDIIASENPAVGICPALFLHI